MGNFMKNMKSAAAQAKVKDHPLFTREYGSEVRNAYFSGAAAALCFLDDELDAEEQNALKLLGLGLHLSAEEIDEVCKSVRGIGDDDKMPFLQEVFALMDSDYLKYALLTDMHGLCLKKGELTEDEKDFINSAAEILFGEEKDIFGMWEAGLTLDNADQAATFSPAVSIPSDPFFVQMAENNRTMYDELLKSLNGNPELKDKLKDKFDFDEEMFKIFLSGYKDLREQTAHAFEADENMSVSQFAQEAKELLQSNSEGFDLKDVTEEDLEKIHSEADVVELILHGMLRALTKSVTEWMSENKEEDMQEWYKKFQADLAAQKEEGDKIFKEAYAAIDDAKRKLLEPRIKEIIVQQLSCDMEALTDDADLIDDLGADSLDLVELVMALEEEFGVDIPDADAERIKTVGDIIRYAVEIQKKKDS